MADSTAPVTLSLVDLVNITVDTIKAVEAAYPADTPGKAKFDTVYNLIMQFAPLASVGATVLEKLLPVVINMWVLAFNKIGLFMHQAAAAAPTPVAA
jgi:hypothetical protein